MIRSLLLMISLGLSACAYTEDGWIWRPFQGPAYDSSEGLLVSPEEGTTYVVAATYLPISRDGRAVFKEHMEALRAELDAEPDGLIGFSLGEKMVGREYRTVTVWESEEAMYGFVLGEAHTAAMADASTIRDPDIEARVVRWEISPDELPLDWADVMDRTDLDGRSVAY